MNNINTFSKNNINFQGFFLFHRTRISVLNFFLKHGKICFSFLIPVSHLSKASSNAYWIYIWIRCVPQLLALYRLKMRTYLICIDVVWVSSQSTFSSLLFKYNKEREKAWKVRHSQVFFFFLIKEGTQGRRCDLKVTYERLKRIKKRQNTLLFDALIVYPQAFHFKLARFSNRVHLFAL